MILLKRTTLFLACTFLLACSDTCNNGHNKGSQPPSRAKELKNVYFFLETSASMGGYLQGNADFIKLIPNLLIDIESRINFKNKSIKINYIADSISKYPNSTAQFIRDISTTPIAAHKSSQMHRLFEMITQKTDSNSISLFVSDCILSYPDDVVRENREINKEKVDGELKALIKQSFSDMKKKNMAASLFAFNSAFYGKYYNYRNDPRILNGDVPRPYYIWAIGDKELIKKFKNELMTIPGFSPRFALDFGTFDEPISAYTLLYKLEKSGSWRYSKNNLTDVEVKAQKPIRFAVALDLSSLPEYAQSKGYITKHAKLDLHGLSASYSIKDIGELNQSKAQPKERNMLEQKTHVFVFEVKEFFDAEGEINLKLPLNYSTEYTKWSTIDDSNIDSLQGKTFGFMHLVDGVREAYQNKNEDFINLSITLKK